MHKFKTQNLKFLISILIFTFYIFNFTLICFSQQSDDIEYTLDITSNTVPLANIFKPNIDLSGRGFHNEVTWPQTLAVKEVLGSWQKDIGFKGMYRLQYSLWDINQLSKDPDSKNNLLGNYENIIKNITESGGIVILDLFGTPAGLGKVLDKKSPPWDLKAFKELVKNTVRDLSCNKRYNIWYEVWNAPDLDDFFLGRKQEYLNLYRAAAEGIKELEAETKIYIPVGGPSVSGWFQDVDGNTILSPEKSLIYELIKFCYHYHLPLDFIAWHSYSTDPLAERENTIYKKTTVKLIRDWLTYFNFDQNTPLIVDEWNFDLNANILAERKEKAYIAASYIPSRIKKMYEAGVDYQLYFCLEDFQNNKEGVVRNVGIFSFDPEHSGYKGGPKAIYNVFKMLANLGSDMFLPKLNDEFAGVISTKTQDYIAVLVYNYIDPEISRNYLSRNISSLDATERKALLNLIKSDKLEKIMHKDIDIFVLPHRSLFDNILGILNPFKKETKGLGVTLSHNLKTLLKKAQELNEQATKFMASNRNIKIGIKNLKENYLYQRYAVDSSCTLNCEFKPVEEKEIPVAETYQETLTLSPYSVQLIILKNKPKSVEPTAETAPAPSTTPDTK